MAASGHGDRQLGIDSLQRANIMAIMSTVRIVETPAPSTMALLMILVSHRVGAGAVVRTAAGVHQR